MTALAAEGPNAEQIEYWNAQSGPAWVAGQQLTDAMIRPLGLAAMERAGLRSGDNVLDVGCGCGDTSLELARRVAPGAVTGIDISTVMLAQARRNATAAGATNVSFANADAQTHDFGARTFDVLFSRFGVMFFADSTAAFTNLRRAMKPQGRLAFVCWQALPENPWMFVPMMAVLQHLPPPPLPEPGAPGPFAFADTERVRTILGDAGFGDIVCEPHLANIAIGGDKATLDQAVAFMLQIGPAGRALREADPSLRSAVEKSVREALVPYQAEGGVKMPAATWVVTARNG